MAYKEDIAGIPVVGQVPIGNPGNAPKIVIFDGNLYIWNGTTWNSTDIPNVTYILKIYRDIISDISNSELIPGATYVITDYRTVHFFLDGDSTILSEINSGPIEPLVVTATSENTISSIAYSLTYPQDILHYDWNPDNWLGDKSFSDIDETGDIETSSIIDGFRGVITYREDTIKKNITHFDFRNVKNRRWAIDITAMTWSSAITYIKGACVSDGVNKVYKSKKSGNNNHVVTDTEWWQLAIYCSSDKYMAWSSDEVNFMLDIPVDYSDYEDRYTFHVNTTTYEDSYYDNFLGAKLTRQDDSIYLTILPNVVFNYIHSSYANTINTNVFIGGKLWGKLSISGESFVGNIIGSNFYNNIIGHSFQANIIGNDFNFNTIGNNFSSNTVGNNFDNNTIANDFNNNTIGNFFDNNIIGDHFTYNTIGNYLISNMIMDYFYYNTIGNNFRFNMIGNLFRSNTIGNDFGMSFNNYNNIGNYFMYNTVGNKITNLVTPDKTNESTGFTYNTIKDNMDFNGVDFSAATLVFSNYNTELFTRSDGALRLKYIDNSDIEVITTVNA